MNGENKTDRVRAEILRMFKYATLFGLCMWGIQIIGGGPVEMNGFLAIYAPLTIGVGIGETANIAKRATAKPEVMEAEARIRNGEPPE
jgi:hypothetical protein